MPVSPGDAQQLGKGMLELYADAELRLLDLIGRAVVKGIDTPSWQEVQLIAVQRLRQQTAVMVRDLEKAGTQAATDAVMAGYNRGAGVAGVDLARLGGSAAGSFGGVDVRAVQALTAAAGGQVRDTGLVIRSQQEVIYRDVVQQTAGRQLAQGMTRRDASWDAMQTWADRGVTGFVDRSGRAWQLSSYAEMIGRTAASQAIMQGHRDRLVDSGNDLVMISDAPEECDKCRPWEGRVLSLTGSTRAGTYTEGDSSYTVAGTLADATAAGLFHPNCRHRTVAYFPGITEPLEDTADPDGDRLRQQQRGRERNIRALKRKAQTARTVAGPKAPATTAANRRLRDAQQAFALWRQLNDRKDLSYRTSIKTPTARKIEAPKPVDPPKRKPRPVPPDVLDWNTRELRAASDADLEAALTRALELDHPNTDRLIGEVDRRDEAPIREAARQAKAKEARALRAEAKAANDSESIAELIAGGMDEREAIQTVTGLTVDKQLRIELTYRLRGEGVAGDTLDEMVRSKFREHNRQAYLSAEDATNGYLLNRQGTARGIDPATLFSGTDARARKYASDELLEWWDQNGGRPTLDQYRDELLTGLARTDTREDYLQ